MYRNFDRVFSELGLSQTVFATPSVFLGTSLFRSKETFKITPYVETNGIFTSLTQTPNTTDDYASDPSTTGVLYLDGTVVSGVIETLGDADWFAFTVAEADTIITFTNTTSFEVIPFLGLAIYDQTENLIAYRSYAYESSPYSFVFETTGNYFLSVYDSSSTQGAYSVTAVEIFDDYAGSTMTTGEMSVDGPGVSGIIDYIGDDDWFALEVAHDGDVVRFNFAGIVGSIPQILMTIYDDLGEIVLPGSTLSPDTSFYHDFVTAGTYYLSVANPWRTGTYSVSAESVADDYAGNTSTTGMITVGGPSITGAIDYGGDEDWFAITIENAGEIVAFLLESDGTSIFRPLLAVYDQSGQNYLSGYFTSVGESHYHVFDTAGTYYLSVEKSGVLGTYSVSATNVIDDFAGDFTTTGSLTVDGPTLNGALDYRGDIDWFALTVSDDGDVIGLTFEPNGHLLSYLNLSIYDDSGNLVSEDFFFNQGGTFYQTFAASGNYYVSLSRSGEVGTYSISATKYPDDYVNGPTTSGVVLIDGTSVTGNIDFAYDQDWFGISVINDGDIIGVDFSLISSNLSSVNINIYDENGTRVGGDGYIYQGDIGYHVFDTAGDYFIGVSPTSNRLGSYEFSVFSIMDDYAGDATTTGTLGTDGTPQSGELTYLGDEDWFAVTVSQDGQVIAFSPESVGGDLHDLWLKVYDGSGTVIASDSSARPGDQLFHAFAEAGTYYISASDNFYLGTYSISAAIIADDYFGGVTTTGIVTPDGTTVTGAIEFDGDDDWFALTITNPDTIIRLNLETLGSGLSNMPIAIYNASGSWVASDNMRAGDSLFAELDTVGTYYVAIQGYNFLGTYSFSVDEIIDDFADDTSTTGSLAVDGPNASGKVDYTDDQDWFEVTVSNDGDVIAFVNEGSSPEINALRMVVFDSSGNAIGSTNPVVFGRSHYQVFDTAGTYYVSVAARNDVDTGKDYLISANTVVDDFAGDITTTASVILDGSDQTGSYDYTNDQDWFAITIGTAGEIVAFNNTGQTGDISVLDMSVYDSLGNLLASDSTVNQSFPFYHVFDSSGTFYISVSGRGVNDIDNNYAFNAVTVIDDFKGDISTTGFVPFDGTVTTGQYDYTGDQDWFALTVLEDGDVVSLRNEFSTNEISRISLIIFDSSGNQLRADSDFRSTETLYHYFDTAGIYYISVSGRTDNNIGKSYAFSATEIPDDYTQGTNTAGVLPFDGSVVSGVYDYNDDQDWFAITVEDVNDIVALKNESSTTDNILELRFTVYNSSGAELERLTFVDQGETTYYQFGDAGTYYVSVTAWASNGSNNGKTYSFSATEIIDDFAGDLTTDATFDLKSGKISGSIDFTDDSDWFQFEISEVGQQVVFEASHNGGSPSGDRLSIYNDAGVLISSVSLSEALTQTFATTGTYYLEYTSGYVGNYDVLIGKVASPEFETVGDNQDYIFDAQRKILYISGDAQGVVKRYDIANNLFLSDIVLGGTLSGMSMSQDGNTLFVGQRDYTPTSTDGGWTQHTGDVTIHQIDLNSLSISEYVFEVTGRERGINDIAFTADGDMLVTTDYDGRGVRRHIICPRFRPGLRETLLIVLVDIKRRLCGIASVDVRLSFS